MKTVFEEGYEGPVPTDEYFGFIKDPKIKEKVSYFLMDKLRLGGAEYAHINRKRDFKLIGADSGSLHLKNVAAYKEASKHRDTIEKDLDAIHKEVERLIQQHFPKELKDWLRLKNRFHESKLNLLDYLRRTPFKGKYPNIALLLATESGKDSATIQEAQEIDPKAIFQEID